KSHLLTSAREALLRERDIVAKDVHSYQGIVSALRRMPPEILCHIFLLAVAHLDLSKAPWHVAHVSQRWRDIAISLPGLWSSFRIGLSTP
ncbi:hypothetical protein B0H13DRAFT_1568336, partial [Mycena leptocephala]